MKEAEVWRRVIKLHERYEKQGCPECGQETTGTISEGGCRWAVCPDCYDQIMGGEGKKGQWSYTKTNAGGRKL